MESRRKHKYVKRKSWEEKGDQKKEGGMIENFNGVDENEQSMNTW